MQALLDINGFYANAELVFDPKIRGRPVVVLTNNDGCICAVNQAAKDAGVGKKFVPYFQVKEDLQRVNAVVRSSNYELYADMSRRFMDTCSRFAPNSHIYSIDECFLDFGSSHSAPPEGWDAYGRYMRRTVWKEVRLPIGVGIGPTPTLAKAASHAAKRIEGFNGVAVIDSDHVRRSILSQMELTDVWGIGRRLAARLELLGVKNAWQLAECDPGWIRKQFSVLVESTVYELKGIKKLDWDEVRAPKKEIYSTRSFGQRVMDKASLRQAILTHVGIAASKLRDQNSLSGHMVVFGANSPHDNAPYYSRSFTHKFPSYTSDTTLLSAAASRLVDQIYSRGIRFYKVGVGLLDLVREDTYQRDMFTINKDKPELMACLDKINGRYGRNSVFVAGQGVEQKFSMRREFLSKQYTTRLSDLPVIKCK
ncbi:Y-family DNA polymerase [Neptuniibacter sp. QD37_11]|uniref:Y-family DNA polymerase n=1 Tax=Neptuniibacter sp. QD37_11 TaxID=3398209 RepID=UPI0039F46407